MMEEREETFSMKIKLRNNFVYIFFMKENKYYILTCSLNCIKSAKVYIEV